MKLRIPRELAAAPVHVLKADRETWKGIANLLASPPFPAEFDGIGDLVETFRAASMAHLDPVFVEMVQADAVTLYWAMEFYNLGHMPPEALED